MVNTHFEFFYPSAGYRETPIQPWGRRRSLSLSYLSQQLSVSSGPAQGDLVLLLPLAGGAQLCIPTSWSGGSDHTAVNYDVVRVV